MLDPGEGRRKTGVERSKMPLHKSDLELYRKSDDGKRSLGDRLQGLGRSARAALRRAFSTEHIYRPQKKEMQDGAGRTDLRLGDRPVGRPTDADDSFASSCSSTSWNDEEGWKRKSVPHTCGQLLQQNADGSQVVELSRAAGRPFGFFLARGRVNQTRGVFVSRMQDEEARRRLAGLLEVGYEVLEVEGADVRAADILEVNLMMAKKRTLLLTVLPYMYRKDV